MNFSPGGGALVYSPTFRVGGWMGGWVGANPRNRLRAAKNGWVGGCLEHNAANGRVLGIFSQTVGSTYTILVNHVNVTLWVGG